MNNEKKTVNYWYFGVLFVLLSLIHGLHVYVVDHISLFSRFVFFVHAVAQSFLEVLLLVLLVKFTQEKLHKSAKAVVVVFTLFLFLTHCADFAMQRIMDMSIWFCFSWLMDESLHNFIEMLYASDISFVVWIGLAAFVIVLPFIALAIYRGSHKASDKKPFALSYTTLFNSLCTVFLLLCVIDLSSVSTVQHDEYTHLRKAVPWKDMFFKPKSYFLSFQRSLKEPFSEDDTSQKMAAQKIALKKKPNIFLFVAESLREDFMTREVAPNLYDFKQANITTPHSYSNANNSHHSWFCIFSSKLPFYWDKYKFENRTLGSVPLQILKQQGYKIHLYTSARLAYYQMDERIFGKDQYLTDTICFHPHEDGVQAYESDTKIINQLCDDVRNLEDEGHVFITFLDSTHFNYSWPEETHSVFTPYVSMIDYIGTSCFKKDLDQVKNRYRNAVHYIDCLFGNFLQTIQSTPSFKESIIVFTGDHGEEFMEHRNLFHATDINNPQTNVPLYMKLGENVQKMNPKGGKFFCHIDIFPTVLHYLFQEDLYAAHFDGNSILKKNRAPYVISSRYNASRSPFEFCINNGHYKLILSFKKEKALFAPPKLKVIAMRDQEDRDIPWNLSLVQEQFDLPLQKLFSAEK